MVAGHFLVTIMQVVSGTPGRVFDMIRRRNLRTRNLKVWAHSPCYTRI